MTPLKAILLILLRATCAVGVSFRPWDLEQQQPLDFNKNPSPLSDQPPGAWRMDIAEVDRISHKLHPVLQEFQHVIESDLRVMMLFQSMFQQAYENTPNIRRGEAVRSYQEMLQALNHIIGQSPAWSDDGRLHPMDMLFRYAMGSPSGMAVFLNPDVNSMLKKVLNTWAEFLQSLESALALNSQTGWLSPTALQQLADAANIGGTLYTFDELFICDPTTQYYGFQSWDSFFTRRFRDDIRPVASPDDDSVIANACESKPTDLSQDVKARDAFWIKGKTYSLVDMFGGEESAEPFIGGTVYQGYLDTLNYHRWHAPVSGRIIKTYTLNGTYFSIPQAMYTDSPNTGPRIIADFPVWLTAMATRAVVLIQAQNPDIGLLAFLAVGMDEVSSCDITVKEGDYVEKGEEIGLFHYGGSSHCLIFRPGVNVTGFPEIGRHENIAVRSHLAVVKQ
ncbi:hypothetical protein BBP40_010146 [Aspergillus hancockii]|nr:hypothetical protein BBP40_010146 [Aspergillus hancockii]